MFVHGEAGVGKTRLVQAVCDEAAAAGVVTLWGQCVRFGAADVPYVSLAGALRAWEDSAPPDQVSQVLRAVPDADGLLPSLTSLQPPSSPRLLAVLDALVHAICALRPTILVVDDVHWADLTSLDGIAYLIAGFRRQRLAVALTYRDEELGSGHPLHGWLADMRRLPAVGDLPLRRLGREETAQQLTALLAGPPHPRLVDEVLHRSEGNPYLTELLVRDLIPADERLPADLPAGLSTALLAVWHRQSPQSREVMRILAVGGRPASADDLIDVCARCALDAEAVGRALVEATTAGVCVVQDGDNVWFRHPLLAEVLTTTFAPGEAKAVHAAWIGLLRDRSSAGVDEVRRQADLALHHEGAHEPDSSVDASLQAADLARDLRLLREEAVQLGKAARLWPALRRDRPPGDELALVERLARVSRLVGSGDDAYAAWSRCIELVDERSDPLRASRVLMNWAAVAESAGQISDTLNAVVDRAIELAGTDPHSAENAMALAFRSVGLAWNRESGQAKQLADAAVRVSQRSGSAEALMLSYEARTYAAIRDESADHDSAECIRFAEATGRLDLVLSARIARGNYLDQRGRRAESSRMMTAGLREALEAGATQHVACYSILVAHDLLPFGRLNEADRVLREGLAVSTDNLTGSGIRLRSALLAVRRGDLDTADLHLRRARELKPDLEDIPGLMAPLVLAEYWLARGQAVQTLDLLGRTLVVQSVDGRVADEMLLWCARAAADLAESARHRRDATADARARDRLRELADLRGSLSPSPFEVLTSDDLDLPALEALYTAETARCLGEATTSEVWRTAVRRCAAAGLGWEEAIASYRLAEALLTEGEDRGHVAEPLRSAYRFAGENTAALLQHRLEDLAKLGRIPLAEPAQQPERDIPVVFRSLTGREREVLAHLTAGRTYAEIAGALFISEKTVSVHVSHLLRKTTTSSSRDLAALAIRLGYGTDP